MPKANLPKPKRPARPRKAEAKTQPRERTPLAPAAGRSPLGPDEHSALAPDDRIVSSNLTLHQLFQQQTSRMLERADLSEEQKQSLLIGMSCPCCGAGGFSFTAKLKR
jgi:hypothetical protein